MGPAHSQDSTPGLSGFKKKKEEEEEEKAHFLRALPHGNAGVRAHGKLVQNNPTKP